jgi:hypothetical protein
VEVFIVEKTKELKNSRKPYKKPELVEWGNITTVTQGGLNGVEEVLSGTNPTFLPPWQPS